MSTIQNRSPYVLTVAGHPELERKFPFAKRATAEACELEMWARHPECKVRLVQETNRFQVRLRLKGHLDQTKTFTSREQAVQFIQEAERQQSLVSFREEVPASGVTTAQLIQRFIKEECPGLRGGKLYAVLLNAMIRDSSNDQKGTGASIAALGADREPMTSLEWLHKPLLEVTAADVQTFVRDRLEVVAPATVDRQLRLLNAVYKVATSKWGFHLDRLPTEGARRPRIFNEPRNRRLQPEEQLRLLNSARREDRLRSIRMRTWELVGRAGTVAVQPNATSSHDQAIKSAYKKARAEALRSYEHVPLLEAFVMYLLGTAARRAEALMQRWHHIDLLAQMAHLRSFKNYQRRTLPFPRDVLALLKQLPRSSDRVFDIGDKELSNAWRRIRKHANIADVRMNDLRHEAMSRAAESGLFPQRA